MTQLRTALIAFGLIGISAAAAVDPPGSRAKIDEPTRKATAQALEWLKSRQNSDGSWSESRYPHNTAITGFALMAFMSQGHLPGQGLYGPEIVRGSRFLISTANADGYLVGSRGGSMYCHAMATLALGELWGAVQDDSLKPTLTKAVDLIVRTQNREGGWRYEPQPKDADVSVTIMQVMALRSAKNGGLHVPDATIQRAIQYIKSCYDEPTGGFGYQHNSRHKPGFARTAAGICVLQLCGAYDAAEIPKGVAYLKANFDTKDHYWYGHYYAAHAMHTIGGEEWDAWYERIRTAFLKCQSADGSWTRAGFDKEGIGPVYTTSIAVMALSVPSGYLPIFQR